MNTKYIYTCLLILLAIGGLSCTEEPNQADLVKQDFALQKEEMAEATIVGSWAVQSTHQITSDTTYSIDPAQTGLLIVNPKRYSMMWTITSEPRTPFMDLSRPTPEEMQTGFKSVAFNAGSYELTDSTIITTAHIAKAPGFEGGKQVYRYEISGKNLLHLTMIDETYPDGTKPSWYGKVEMMFVMERVK